MDSSFGKEGILSRLRLLDEDLDFRFGGARKFELVISGGSALSIRGLIPSRVTTDIDVLSVPDEVVDLMSAYDMNSHVDTFRYMYPTHWHDRIRPVEFDGSVLDVYTLGNEDLAITKLLSWRGDKDRRDLENMIQWVHQPQRLEQHPSGHYRGSYQYHRGSMEPAQPTNSSSGWSRPLFFRYEYDFRISLLLIR